MLPSYLGPALPGLRHPRPGARALPAQPPAPDPRRRLRAGADRARRRRRAGKPARPEPSVLRSVSPVHVEYMRNMGTTASMSISILRRRRALGPDLLPQPGAAARAAARPAPPATSSARSSLCRLARQGARRSGRSSAWRCGAIQARLLARMAEAERFVDGLLKHPDDLLALADAAGRGDRHAATGAACVGATPQRGATCGARTTGCRRAERGGEVFATEALARDMRRRPRPSPDTASGAAGDLHLADVRRATSSGSGRRWSAPCKWGGDPRKAAELDPAGGPDRLHPRKSFEIWKETVRARSLPWSAGEVEAAKDLRAPSSASCCAGPRSSPPSARSCSARTRSWRRSPTRSPTTCARRSGTSSATPKLLHEPRGRPTSPNKGRHYVDTIIEAAFSAGTLVDNLLSLLADGPARPEPDLAAT